MGSSIQSRPRSSIAWQRCNASPRWRPWLKSIIRCMSSPGVADGRNGCDVVTHALAPQPQLEAGEPAFVAQLDRLGGYRGRLFQPQAIAVVGGHRPDRAAEKDAQGARRLLVRA